MIVAMLIDFDTLQVKEIIHISNFSTSKKVWDYSEFEVTILGIKNLSITTTDILSIFDGDTCVYSGMLLNRDEETGKSSGYSLRYAGAYRLYDESNPVAETTVSKTTTGFIEAMAAVVFPNATIITDYDADISTDLHEADVRAKHHLEIVREACVETGTTYELYAIGNGRLKIKVMPCRDLSESVNLFAGISASQIAKVIDKRASYNQILGLGSGEGADRDYVFIDKSNGSSFKRCYIYDVKSDITHAKLNSQTKTKLKELTSANYTKFSILDNNLAKYGTDYHLGDTITFISRNGKSISDMISEVSISIENGKLLSNYEGAIGTGKYRLTTKINELKEGGTK